MNALSEISISAHAVLSHRLGIQNMMPGGWGMKEGHKCETHARIGRDILGHIFGWMDGWIGIIDIEVMIDYFYDNRARETNNTWSGVKCRCS